VTNSRWELAIVLIVSSSSGQSGAWSRFSIRTWPGAFQGTGQRRGPGDQSNRRIGLILTDGDHRFAAADRDAAAETNSPRPRIRCDDLHAHVPGQPIAKIAADDGRALAG
jgi:hypothetical protein